MDDLTLIDDVSRFYQRLSDDVAGAERSIRLEMYTLQEGEIVRRLLGLMAERARNGVRVELIYDAVGSYGLSEATLAPLRKAGGQITPYHPLHLFRRERKGFWATLFRRDHRKLAIIDDRIWYLGGMNVGERFFGWHDVMARGEGGPVEELVEGFERVVKGLHPPRKHPLRLDVDRPVVVIDSRPTLGVYPVKRMFMSRIKKAKRRIWIAQAYFLPRHRLRKGLERARHRGVDVRIVTPDRSDVKVADLAAWTPIAKLVKKEVAVFRFVNGMLHTKMALIDDTLIIGAANLDSMSLYWNRELAMMTRDARTVEEGERLFLDYLDSSRPVTMGTLRSLPVSQRFLGWLLEPFHWIL